MGAGGGEGKKNRRKRKGVPVPGRQAMSSKQKNGPTRRKKTFVKRGTKRAPELCRGGVLKKREKSGPERKGGVAKSSRREQVTRTGKKPQRIGCERTNDGWSIGKDRRQKGDHAKNESMREGKGSPKIYSKRRRFSIWIWELRHTELGGRGEKGGCPQGSGRGMNGALAYSRRQRSPTFMGKKKAN